MKITSKAISTAPSSPPPHFICLLCGRIFIHVVGIIIFITRALSAITALPSPPSSTRRWAHSESASQTPWSTLENTRKILLLALTLPGSTGLPTVISACRRPRLTQFTPPSRVLLCGSHAHLLFPKQRFLRKWLLLPLQSDHFSFQSCCIFSRKTANLGAIHFTRSAFSAVLVSFVLQVCASACGPCTLR